MQDRWLFQISLIKIISVLTFSIRTYQPFIVHVRHSISSGFGIKIIQIPQAGTCNKRTFHHFVKIMFMINQAIFLREVETFRLIRMNTGIYTRTIFRHYQHFALIHFMSTVKQTLELINIRFIPTLIEIPSLNHRYLRQMSSFIKSRCIMIGHHSISWRIFLTYCRFQSPGYLFSKMIIIFELLTFRVGTTQENLIHISPNHDRRAIEVLTYHFFCHFNAVSQKLFRFCNGINDGNLNRSHNTQFITHLHNDRILRVMRNT